MQSASVSCLSRAAFRAKGKKTMVAEVTREIRARAPSRSFSALRTSGEENNAPEEENEEKRIRRIEKTRNTCEGSEGVYTENKTIRECGLFAHNIYIRA